MKKICDHCDGPLKKEYDDDCAIWCQQCVVDNIDLLNALDLLDEAGTHINIHSTTHAFFKISGNVAKMHSVPKKGQAPTPAPVPVVVQPPTTKLDPPFDFEKYNHTFAGKRYG
jgi:hypothetical protein